VRGNGKYEIRNPKCETNGKLENGKEEAAKKKQRGIGGDR